MSIATTTCTFASSTTGTFTVAIDSTPSIIAGSITSISVTAKPWDYTGGSFSSGTLTGHLAYDSSVTSSVVTLIAADALGSLENDIQIVECDIDTDSTGTFTFLKPDYSYIKLAASNGSVGTLLAYKFSADIDNGDDTMTGTIVLTGVSTLRTFLVTIVPIR